MMTLRSASETLRKLALSRTVQLFLLASFLYWLIGGVLTPNTSNLEFENVVRAAIAVAVTIAYLPVCLDAALAPRPDRVQQLSLGIVLSWVSTVAVSLWYTLYRYSGRPIWMMDANVYGYMVYLQILGGILHITAPGAAGAGIPRKNWIALGVSSGFAVLIALLFIVYEPNLSSLMAYLEKWFRSYPDSIGPPYRNTPPGVLPLPPAIR